MSVCPSILSSFDFSELDFQSVILALSHNPMDKWIPKYYVQLSLYLSKLEEVLQCLWVSVEGVTVGAVSVSPGLAPPWLQQPAHADP